jgi:ATP-dependent Clp protease adapter protein ClpS
MMFPDAVLAPPAEEIMENLDSDTTERVDEPWKVILYNDDIHSFDEVILQLIKALGCSSQKAGEIAFEAHTTGKAIAFSGAFEDCFRVAGVLREIQLIVEIEG